MSDVARAMKVQVSLIIFVFGSVAAVAAILSTFQHAQKAELAQKVSALTEEKTRLTRQSEELKKLLADKDKALTIAEKNNFQADLLAAQAALKDANERLSGFLGQRSGLENSKAVLENRLQSTTTELTKALEELKKARMTLGGIEEQYKDKMTRLEEQAKEKDLALQKFQEKLKEKEGSSADFQKREQETSDSLRKYRLRVAELEKTVGDLNRSLADNEKALSQVKSGAGRQVPGASFDRERVQLEKQISDSSARLFDQQEELKSLERKVASLTGMLAEKEAALAKRESELKQRAAEVDVLKDRVYALRAASSYGAETGPLLTQTQKELEQRVKFLEKEREALQDKLYQAKNERAPSDRGARSATVDRDVRILTQTLVKKEEQIKQLEAELLSFKNEKLSQAGGAGIKERRLQELEILVTMLTKQLGEYASLLEKKDADLKAAQEKVAYLSQEVEAQKVASGSLQKELVDARARQDKTLQSLTQIMGMNSVPLGAGVGAQENSEQAAAPAELSSSENEWMTPDDTSGSGMEEPPLSEEEAKKKVEELKRRVEVMLEER